MSCFSQRLFRHRSLFLVLAGMPMSAQVAIDEQFVAFTPQGASARAVGIGGAFTAVADDATAVSFNPAGLAQLLKPEVTFVGMRTEKELRLTATGQFPDLTPFSLQSLSTADKQNEPLFLSMTFPWKKWDRNFVFQLSTQRLFEMEAHSNTVTTIAIPGETALTGFTRLDSQGSINMNSLALAAELTPRVLLGLTLNSWRGLWETNAQSHTAFPNDPLAQDIRSASYEKARIRGLNWTLGGMWRFEYITFSAVYRTPFNADFSSTTHAAILAPVPQVESASHTFQVRWPETLSLGLAFRPHPRWLIAGDWANTEWSKTRYLAPGSALDGKNFFNVDDPSTVRDTNVRRLGVEFIPTAIKGVLIPLRAGYFDEPQFTVDPVTRQQRVLKGWTIGTGLRFRNAWVDLAYKTSRGNRATSLGLRQNSQDFLARSREEIREHRFYVSFTVQFKQEIQRKFLKWLFVEG